MRVLAAILLFTAVVIQILLGGGLLLSSWYEADKARTEAQVNAGDLSMVAGDLASPEELEQMRKEAAKKLRQAGGTAGSGAATRQLVLGVLVLVLALCGIPAGILHLLGRAHAAVLAVMGLSAVALLAAMILDGFSTIMGICVGLLAVSALLVALAKPRGRGASPAR